MSEIKLSTDEAELYDRQIRLWGIESQEKLRAANVLLIKIRGLGSEVAKDILLCGINSLTILDDGVVTKEEILKNFLLSEDSIEKKIAEAVVPKAQALNPLVKIISRTESLEDLEDAFFHAFTIIIATGLSTQQLLKISRICRDKNIKFICGDNFGMFGFSIADFQQHNYFEDQVQFVGAKKRSHEGIPTKQKAERTTVKVAGLAEYPCIAEVINFPEVIVKSRRRNVYYYLMLALLQFRDKYGRDPYISTKEKDLEVLKEIKEKILEEFQVQPDKLKDEVFNLIFGEIVPICSIVGGVIAQEVIKAVSGREVPINNVFLLDPYTYSGREETVCLVGSLT